MSGQKVGDSADWKLIKLMNQSLERESVAWRKQRTWLDGQQQISFLFVNQDSTSHRRPQIICSLDKG